MATVEEKVEAVLKEVKSLAIGQLKLTTTVDDLHRRMVDAAKISTDLKDEIQSLTSRIEVLEALSQTAAPQAPPREEERRAKGHGDTTNLQGNSEGGLGHPECPGQG
ncbi:unnamed protein product [Urochloa humidicola]